MRILHVTPTYLPATRYGGPIYSVHGLCKALVARGHDVHVVTTTVDGAGDSEVPLGEVVEMDGVKVWYFRSPFLRRLYFSPDMGRWLKRELSGFDVVHLHSVFLWPTNYAARICVRVAVPYALAPRGMLVRELIQKRRRWVKSMWLRLVERYTLTHAAGIQFTTDWERERASDIEIKSKRSWVIPNGVDKAPVTGLTAATEKRDGVLYLGRINWEKGLERLIRDLPEVTGKLRIVGNDEEMYGEKLLTLARELGVEDQVVFSGPRFGVAKWSLLASASVFVLPSLSENFGNVVLEAMLGGCPVVLSKQVGVASLVQAAGVGEVVDGTPGSFAAAINRLLVNETQREEMAAKAQQWVVRHFAWPVVASRIEVAYEEITCPPA